MQSTTMSIIGIHSTTRWWIGWMFSHQLWHTWQTQWKNARLLWITIFSIQPNSPSLFSCFVLLHTGLIPKTEDKWGLGGLHIMARASLLRDEREVCLPWTSSAGPQTAKRGPAKPAPAKVWGWTTEPHFFPVRNRFEIWSGRNLFLVVCFRSDQPLWKFATSTADNNNNNFLHAEDCRDSHRRTVARSDSRRQLLTLLLCTNKYFLLIEGARSHCYCQFSSQHNARNLSIDKITRQIFTVTIQSTAAADVFSTRSRNRCIHEEGRWYF